MSAGIGLLANRDLLRRTWQKTAAQRPQPRMVWKLSSQDRYPIVELLMGHWIDVVRLQQELRRRLLAYHPSSPGISTLGATVNPLRIPFFNSPNKVGPSIV